MRLHDMARPVSLACLPTRGPRLTQYPVPQQHPSTTATSDCLPTSHLPTSHLPTSHLPVCPHYHVVTLSNICTHTRMRSRKRLTCDSWEAMANARRRRTPVRLKALPPLEPPRLATAAESESRKRPDRNRTKKPDQMAPSGHTATGN